MWACLLNIFNFPAQVPREGPARDAPEVHDVSSSSSEYLKGFSTPEQSPGHISISSSSPYLSEFDNIPPPPSVPSVSVDFEPSGRGKRGRRRGPKWGQGSSSFRSQSNLRRGQSARGQNDIPEGSGSRQVPRVLTHREIDLFSKPYSPSCGLNLDEWSSLLS